MADASDPCLSDSTPGIKALPPTTVRQLGSSQVLVDPSSVVKELIDNALDARASAIWVDIAANTMDSVQVKDNGHGIPAEDRPLVCRRYCTSKIRDFQDLKEVGGKWLGFRGEAMASMAEMSGTLVVTTRVEGEPVAVSLQYGRNGGLDSTGRASHPVGTTVKVTDFFKSLPVRKQAALKHSSKWLAKIRHMMQAYALARPTVRFQLRILKAKSDKGNFSYSPKIGASVEDAAFKVIGRGCASQCDWTAIEADGFEVQAFVPRPDADNAGIANVGAFISIDGRPVNPTRGIPKKVASIFKERLRKANFKFTAVRDPFIFLNLLCPPSCYDPNIEPAKDDVLFEDGKLVVNVVKSLFDSFYPEAVQDTEEGLESPLPEPSMPSNPIRPATSSTMLFDVHEDQASGKSSSLAATPTPRWRTSMYGIDEEDLPMQKGSISLPVIEEEEEGARAAEVSNPWTIAKMNTSTRNRPASNVQLPTPAKSHADVVANYSSSPMATSASSRRFGTYASSLMPTTPNVVNVENISPLVSQQEYDQRRGSMEPPIRNRDVSENLVTVEDEDVRPIPSHDERQHPMQRGNESQPLVSPPTPPRNDAHDFDHRERSRRPQHSTPISTQSLLPTNNEVSLAPQASRRDSRRKQPFRNKPFTAPFKYNGSRSSRRKPERQARASTNQEDDDSAHAAFDETVASENNTDIRTFFENRAARSRHQQRSASLEATLPPNVPSGGIIDQLRHHADKNPTQATEREYEDQFLARSDQQNLALGRTDRNCQGIIRRPISAPQSDHNCTNTHADDANSMQASRPSTSAVPRSHSYYTRSKSSKLPLERTPPGFLTQNLVVDVATSITSIRVSMRKWESKPLAREDSNDGDDSIGNTHNAFALPIANAKARDWAISIARMLATAVRLQGGDHVVGMIVEGIRNAVEERNDNLMDDEDDDEEILPV